MGNVTHVEDIGGGLVSVAFVSSRMDDRSALGWTEYNKYETYRITAEPDAGCELLGLQFRRRYWYVRGSSIGTTEWDVWSNWWDGVNGEGSYGVTQTGANEYEFWVESASFQNAYPQNSYQPYWGQIYEVRGVFTQAPQYVVVTASNPSAGGTTTGGGTYASGATCTVIATLANGYAFVRWVLSTGDTSTSRSYSFQVTQDTTATAYFRQYTHMPLHGSSGTILHGSSGSILYDG